MAALEETTERVPPVCTNEDAQACEETPQIDATTTKSTRPPLPPDGSYTAHDDVSWAVKSETLQYPYHQDQYDRFMSDCRRRCNYCKSKNALRLHMNNHQPPSVQNFTRSGISKVKTPPSLWKLLTDFYRNNQGQQVREYDADVANPYHNMWDVPTQILRLDNATLNGGGTHLQAQISRAVQSVLEGWTRQKLSPVSVYGIRYYRRNSILTPHVDRLPLIASAIINIDQDGMDEPWPLEIYDHDGKARNITMEPGDMVLYESHSVIHGRPFPLRGNLYANAFLHFEPLGPLMVRPNQDNNKMPTPIGTNGNGAPHYIIPGSVWEEEWKRDNPNGWEVLNSAADAVIAQNFRALQLIAQVRPEALQEKDDKGWAPIHQAARLGNLGLVKFLIEEGGVSPNQASGFPGSPNDEIFLPIEVATHILGEDHEVTKYLWTVTKL